MIGDSSVLGVICARGGSRGLPGKNLAQLGGRPLIAWSIEAALNAHSVDRVIVSSDDQAIIAAAVEHGAEAPFVRPAELAADDTPGALPVAHALRTLKEQYDYVVLLQPTSPFRAAEDVDGAVALCAEAGTPAVVTVVAAHTSPYWTFLLDGAGLLKPVVPASTPLLRRQDLPPTYELNGAVYVARVDWFLSHETFLAPGTRAFVMPSERSLDIDTALDLLVARAIVKSGGR
jgi:CMP-N,N'-diacetyllegionaminic acid synthase